MNNDVGHVSYWQHVAIFYAGVQETTARMLGMHWENEIRKARGESPVYGEAAFEDIVCDLQSATAAFTKSGLS